MFVIQPVNKFYNNRKFVGVHSDTNLPYIVYEGNKDFPADVYDFKSLENAINWLSEFIHRDNIDVLKLSTSELVDISLVNNANQFLILECEIEDNKLNIVNNYPQKQFDRDNWYKG